MARAVTLACCWRGGWKRKGFGRWEYVTGWRGRSSHAWLRQGNVIVDVTADQFPDMDQPVIVTTDDGWHRQFDRQPQPLKAFGPSDPLNDAYAKLIGLLSR